MKNEIITTFEQLTKLAGNTVIHKNRKKAAVLKDKYLNSKHFKSRQNDASDACVLGYN